MQYKIYANDGIKHLTHFFFTTILLLSIISLASLFASQQQSDSLVNYKKYGKFVNVGTGNYRYIIKKYRKLQKAVEPGIFPNFDGIKKNPDYIEANIKGKLEGYLWDFIDKKRDYMINFYKWATTPSEQLGVKLFYVGYALEHAGKLRKAINAYYALLVHVPKTLSYTYWHTPLYMGKIAIDRIKLLTRLHPELGIKLIDAKITIENCFDVNISNDKYTYINPGRLIKISPSKVVDKPVNLKKFKIIEIRGGKNASVKKYNNGHWQFFVHNKPFFVKGIAYSPNLIGKSPDYGTLDVSKDWQLIDINNNKINDVFFESYIDKNKNNKKDKNEPRIGDAEIMKTMGVNTLRLYHHCYNKKLFRKLYKKYGFYIMLGDFLGAYAVGSGANWNVGTDYSDETQQQRMIESVKKMVNEYKAEPYVLMWVLGNENNFGNANNSPKNPEAYYSFVNKVAKIIHKLDPSRPVAICNGDLGFLDIFAKKCPDIDIMGVNSYRGSPGFGDSLWNDVKNIAGKPVVITEYGCPAYAANLNNKEAEKEQKIYHKGNWSDIYYNRAGSGIGNSIGGIIFEFTDEWWKAGTGTNPNVHDTQPQFGGPFIDGWSYEEWFGLTSQGDGSDSPFLRQLRPSYFYYKKVWNTKNFIPYNNKNELDMILDD